MDLIELIRDFIPDLGALDDGDLNKFDKLAYALVKFDPVQISFTNTYSFFLSEWFGVPRYKSLNELFQLEQDFESTRDAMIKLGKELGAATAVEIQRRVWEFEDNT
jgi:hypothetical protein